MTGGANNQQPGTPGRFRSAGKPGLAARLPAYLAAVLAVMITVGLALLLSPFIPHASLSLLIAAITGNRAVLRDSEHGDGESPAFEADRLTHSRFIVNVQGVGYRLAVSQH